MSLKPKIIAYLKQECGWSKGVRSVLDKYNFTYNEKTLSSAENYQEMVQLSNQTQQPTLQIEDIVLADVSGAEIEKFLLTNKYINEILPQTDGVDIGLPCTEEEEIAKVMVNQPKSGAIKDIAKVMTSGSMGGFSSG